jgi:hypothetical protein
MSDVVPKFDFDYGAPNPSDKPFTRTGHIELEHAIRLTGKAIAGLPDSLGCGKSK